MPRKNSHHNQEVRDGFLAYGVEAPTTQDDYDNQHLSGLFIFGFVIERTRRTISTRDNTQTEIVTYTIQDNDGHRFYVDEYAPKDYHDIGSFVDLPVYVKTFRKRNGDIGYSFGVQATSSQTRGEHF
ncbi:MAG: hypothetical protein IJ058_14550 [Lachnospiraceae bacterium]|nr:hypothetical protein [Lachnospiraceae bacterium]MBQ8948002.1 hypothetical protein [Lachnospiraceae bacterium]